MRVNGKLIAIAGLWSATIATPALADVCTGVCGTEAPNGSVTAPPAYGPNFQYVTTDGGVNGVGEISGVGGTNGSELLTSSFSGLTGDHINFYFNYVTADGSSDFTDYSFAELLNGGAHAAWLFTARTTPSGDTSPGFGLPANDSVLTPSTTPIVAGAPTWDALGGSSNSCYAAGCGYTGWIGSSYTLPSAGSYQVRFGVTNVGDTDVQSGLAFDGLTVNNVPITGAVPEPAAWALMIVGFGAVGVAMRRRHKVTTRLSFAS